MVRAIVLFDDTCDKCNRWARFIQKGDSTTRLRIVGQNSDEGRALLNTRPDNLIDTDSVFLVSAGGIWYAKSAAIWRIAFKMRFPWPLAAAMWLVPAPIRDLCYDIYASRR
mgnify:FL=1|jgi:predicted DCC family thiol-disulfide oxidoreductase YuxK